MQVKFDIGIKRRQCNMNKPCLYNPCITEMKLEKKKRNSEFKRQTTNFYYTEGGYKGQRANTSIEVRKMAKTTRSLKTENREKGE